MFEGWRPAEPARLDRSSCVDGVVVDEVDADSELPELRRLGYVASVALDKKSLEDHICGARPGELDADTDADEPVEEPVDELADKLNAKSSNEV